MSSIVYRINSLLSRVVQGVPIGTNLGLFYLLWMILSGRLLVSRGAVIPGLADTGVAATQPAIPTGFWDRNPKPTSGRLRRVLAGVHFSEFEGLPEQLRKKQSPTEHLPKGVLGHRRHKKASPVLYDQPIAA